MKAYASTAVLNPPTAEGSPARGLAQKVPTMYRRKGYVVEVKAKEHRRSKTRFKCCIYTFFRVQENAAQWFVQSDPENIGKSSQGTSRYCMSCCNPANCRVFQIRQSLEQRDMVWPCWILRRSHGKIRRMDTDFSGPLGNIFSHFEYASWLCHCQSENSGIPAIVMILRK